MKRITLKTKEYYNKVQKRQFLEKQLKIESNLVRKNSLDVLKDFENIGLLLL